MIAVQFFLALGLASGATASFSSTCVPARGSWVNVYNDACTYCNDKHPVWCDTERVNGTCENRGVESTNTCHDMYSAHMRKYPSVTSRTEAYTEVEACESMMLVKECFAAKSTCSLGAHIQDTHYSSIGTYGVIRSAGGYTGIESYQTCPGLENLKCVIFAGINGVGDAWCDPDTPTVRMNASRKAEVDKARADAQAAAALEQKLLDQTHLAKSGWKNCKRDVPQWETDMKSKACSTSTDQGGFESWDMSKICGQDADCTSFATTVVTEGTYAMRYCKWGPNNVACSGYKWTRDSSGDYSVWYCFNLSTGGGFGTTSSVVPDEVRDDDVYNGTPRMVGRGLPNPAETAASALDRCFKENACATGCQTVTSTFKITNVDYSAFKYSLAPRNKFIKFVKKELPKLLRIPDTGLKLTVEAAGDKKVQWTVTATVKPGSEAAVLQEITGAKGRAFFKKHTDAVAALLPPISRACGGETACEISIPTAGGEEVGGGVGVVEDSSVETRTPGPTLPPKYKKKTVVGFTIAGLEFDMISAGLKSNLTAAIREKFLETLPAAVRNASATAKVTFSKVPRQRRLDEGRSLQSGFDTKVTVEITADVDTPTAGSEPDNFIVPSLADVSSAVKKVPGLADAFADGKALENLNIPSDSFTTTTTVYNENAAGGDESTTGGKDPVSSVAQTFNVAQMVCRVSLLVWLVVSVPGWFAQ